ncbi:MAG: hypothetical protein VX958_02755, partial [Planctomycetota bacterium]|nr:hypothetical protein [Planctomycetota bacterium]
MLFFNGLCSPNGCNRGHFNCGGGSLSSNASSMTPGKKKRVKARGRSAGGTLTLIDTRLAGVALAQRGFIFYFCPGQR